MEWPAGSMGVHALSLLFVLLGAMFFSAVQFAFPKVLPEAVIGIVYVVGASLAILIADRSPHAAEHIQHMLNGSILWITWQGVATMAVTTVLAGAVRVWPRSMRSTEAPIGPSNQFQSTVSRGDTIQKSMNQSDFAVIQMLLRDGALTINEMIQRLGVTATAVRQRLSRLQESGLIQRSAVVDGRGRPSHRYELTEAGRRTVGNNLSDLACALWAEIHEIEDATIRRRVVAGAVRRLAEGYANQVTGDTVAERFKSAAKLFSDRDIPIALETEDGLPVLRVLQCPYPDLANDDHRVCEMEQQLFSQVIGGPVDLCQCQQSGDRCCTFQAEPGAGAESGVEATTTD